MIVVSLLGHTQSAKIHHQLQSFWKKSGSLSAISVKSGQAATQFSTCSAFNASGTEREQPPPPPSPSMTIFCTVSLLISSSSAIIQSDKCNFVATFAKPF
jgi:hypothetical protein